MLIILAIEKAIIYHFRYASRYINENKYVRRHASRNLRGRQHKSVVQIGLLKFYSLSLSLSFSHLSFRPYCLFVDRGQSLCPSKSSSNGGRLLSLFLAAAVARLLRAGLYWVPSTNRLSGCVALVNAQRFALSGGELLANTNVLLREREREGGGVGERRGITYNAVTRKHAVREGHVDFPFLTSLSLMRDCVHTINYN